MFNDRLIIVSDICDKMCIVHTSNFFSFKDSENLVGKVHRSEICRNDRGMVAL